MNSIQVYLMTTYTILHHPTRHVDFIHHLEHSGSLTALPTGTEVPCLTNQLLRLSDTVAKPFTS